MACVPVQSHSQEEIDVFTTYQAWLEHGFQPPMSSPTDFPLPDDDMVELGEMKRRPANCLTKRSHIYVHYFGADPSYKGHGYGRSLLQFIIEMSETRNMPLVLETTTYFNISQYERYGFQVVDRVEARSEFVLMVRETTKMQE